MTEKALSKTHPPKTLGTRVSCNMDTGLGRERARQA